ncbi:MAG: KilA-N domain-containing protein, partial [Rikenellaceae bacterium]
MNTANSQVFLYNNEPVTFQLEGESKMVNATQMAKPFNKRVANWLQGKQTQELITILSAETGIPASGLVVTNKGGINQQGTWLHIDLALIFAQWLSPRFYFWCNAKVMELMNNGYALSEEFKHHMS